MGDETRAILIKVLEGVLEQLAFLFGEAAEREQLLRDSERYLHATMEFKGSQAGALGVAIPVELGVLLASNILGVDEGEEVPLEKSIDALKELLNIVCGQLLTALYGEKPIFDLSVPKVLEIDRGTWEQLTNRSDIVGMVIEEIPLIAHVSY